jgi:diadenylate cyclase
VVNTAEAPFTPVDGPMIQALINYLRSVFYSDAYSPGQIFFELFLIGIVVYGVLRFLHGTRGARLLQGMVILVVGGFLIVNVLADWFRLERIAVLYEPFVWAVLLTTLVVFQPELRRGLMRLGETRWHRISQSEIEDVSRTISTACAQLSKNKIGALIAIERDIGLGGLTDLGVKLDARLSAELLNTIFWPGSALHDLGVVIQEGRISAAGVQFPLGDAEGLDRSIGSRHRAAIGLSLDSDALVVVVSEETGSISIAERGHLHRHIRPELLYETLRRCLTNARVARAPGEEEVVIHGWPKEEPVVDQPESDHEEEGQTRFPASAPPPAADPEAHKQAAEASL